MFRMCMCVCGGCVCVSACLSRCDVHFGLVKFVYVCIIVFNHTHTHIHTHMHTHTHTHTHMHICTHTQVGLIPPTSVPVIIREYRKDKG